MVKELMKYFATEICEDIIEESYSKGILRTVFEDYPPESPRFETIDELVHYMADIYRFDYDEAEITYQNGEPAIFISFMSRDKQNPATKEDYQAHVNGECNLFFHRLFFRVMKASKLTQDDWHRAGFLVV